MIDAASGGDLRDKRQSISNMVENTQQFHSSKSTRAMHETQATYLDSERIDNRLAELTSLVR